MNEINLVSRDLENFNFFQVHVLQQFVGKYVAGTQCEADNKISHKIGKPFLIFIHKISHSTQIYSYKVSCNKWNLAIAQLKDFQNK